MQEPKKVEVGRLCLVLHPPYDARGLEPTSSIITLCVGELCCVLLAPAKGADGVNYLEAKDAHPLEPEAISQHTLDGSLLIGGIREATYACDYLRCSSVQARSLFNLQPPTPSNCCGMLLCHVSDTLFTNPYLLADGVWSRTAQWPEQGRDFCVAGWRVIKRRLVELPEDWDVPRMFHGDTRLVACDAQLSDLYNATGAPSEELRAFFRAASQWAATNQVLLDPVRAGNLQNMVDYQRPAPAAAAAPAAAPEGAQKLIEAPKNLHQARDAVPLFQLAGCGNRQTNDLAELHTAAAKVAHAAYMAYGVEYKTVMCKGKLYCVRKDLTQEKIKILMQQRLQQKQQRLQAEQQLLQQGLLQDDRRRQTGALNIMQMDAGVVGRQGQPHQHPEAQIQAPPEAPLALLVAQAAQGAPAPQALQALLALPVAQVALEAPQAPLALLVAQAAQAPPQALAQAPLALLVAQAAPAPQAPLGLPVAHAALEAPQAALGIPALGPQAAKVLAALEAPAAPAGETDGNDSENELLVFKRRPAKIQTAGDHKLVENGVDRPGPRSPAAAAVAGRRQARPGLRRPTGSPVVAAAVAAIAAGKRKRKAAGAAAEAQHHEAARRQVAGIAAAHILRRAEAVKAAGKFKFWKGAVKLAEDAAADQLSTLARAAAAAGVPEYEGPAIDCPICFDTTECEPALQLGCDHVIHAGCLAQYLQTEEALYKETNQYVCPVCKATAAVAESAEAQQQQPPPAGWEISSNHIAKLTVLGALTAEQEERINRQQIRRAVGAEHSCIQCNMLLDLDPGPANAPSAYMVKCGACNTQQCVACGKAWSRRHANLTCAEMRALDTTADPATRLTLANTVVCAGGCGHGITKDEREGDSCNVMKCQRCRVYTCFLCGDKLDSSKFDVMDRHHTEASQHYAVEGHPCYDATWMHKDVWLSRKHNRETLQAAAADAEANAAAPGMQGMGGAHVMPKRQLVLTQEQYERLKDVDIEKVKAAVQAHFPGLYQLHQRAQHWPEVELVIDGVRQPRLQLERAEELPLPLPEDLEPEQQQQADVELYTELGTPESQVGDDDEEDTVDGPGPIREQQWLMAADDALPLQRLAAEAEEAAAADAQSQEQPMDEDPVQLLANLRRDPGGFCPDHGEQHLLVARADAALLPAVEPEQNFCWQQGLEELCEDEDSSSDDHHLADAGQQDMNVKRTRYEAQHAFQQQQGHAAEHHQGGYMQYQNQEQQEVMQRPEAHDGDSTDAQVDSPPKRRIKLIVKRLLQQ